MACFFWTLISSCLPAEDPAARKPATEKQSANIQKGEKQSGDKQPGRTALELHPTVDKFLAVKNQIAERRLRLERQRDRRQKLISLLSVGANRGCMGEVIVKRIDISVEGSHLDNLPLSSSSITVDSPAEFLRESSKICKGG